MPALDHFLPIQSPKVLERKIQRAERVLRFLRMTEPARMAIDIRQETRMLRTLFDAWNELGTCGAEQMCALAKVLNMNRSQMLELIGLPKRPGRPMVDERTVRMIREALPEEILVPEPEIEPPPAPVKPPST